MNTEYELYIDEDYMNDQTFDSHSYFIEFPELHGDRELTEDEIDWGYSR